MGGEVVDNLLTGFENVSARGAEAVTFEDSVADGFGLANADEVYSALRAGELGAAGSSAFILHGFAIPASYHQK